MAENPVGEPDGDHQLLRLPGKLLPRLPGGNAQKTSEITSSQSNRESGNGRPDILLKYPSVRGKAVIIEIKVSKTYQGLEEKCDEALRQI